MDRYRWSGVGVVLAAGVVALGRVGGFWSVIYSKIETFQTLLTGLLAIAAAIIAYSGARQQAAAAIAVGRLSIDERRRSTASVLFAELSNARLMLMVQARGLRRFKGRRRTMLPVQKVPLQAFNSEPLAIGVLPADVAYVATLAYSVLIDHNLLVEKLLTPSEAEISDDYAGNLADRLDSLLDKLDAAIRAVGSYSDIDPAILEGLTANAAMLRQQS